MGRCRCRPDPGASCRRGAPGTGLAAALALLAALAAPGPELSGSTPPSPPRTIHIDFDSLPGVPPFVAPTVTLHGDAWLRDGVELRDSFLDPFFVSVQRVNPSNVSGTIRGYSMHVASARDESTWAEVRFDPPVTALSLDFAASAQVSFRAFDARDEVVQGVTRQGQRTFFLPSGIRVRSGSVTLQRPPARIARVRIAPILPHTGLTLDNLRFTRPRRVTIDLRPGNPVNPIHPDAHGVVRLALLGNDDFDVATVDPGSLRLGPAQAAPLHDLQRPGALSGHLRDADRDGRPDLVLHFRVNHLGLRCGDAEVTLTGHTRENEVFVGSDAVITRGCDRFGLDPADP